MKTIILQKHYKFDLLKTLKKSLISSDLIQDIEIPSVKWSDIGGMENFRF